ncbi:hypothetical protein PoB_001290100 [Plakobranchus ocellatus]|uniref:Uncharacterized protein n=1 Tax=Plakobranchus ocellatus TaxID=259542 RepID=A0AAV3YVI8_9GAST|nr:hypothetical protein PoB_001290100 [Plakobranchus ocellatus]
MRKRSKGEGEGVEQRGGEEEIEKKEEEEDEKEEKKKTRRRQDNEEEEGDKEKEAVEETRLKLLRDRYLQKFRISTARQRHASDIKINHCAT